MEGIMNTNTLCKTALAVLMIVSFTGQALSAEQDEVGVAGAANNKAELEKTFPKKRPYSKA